MIFVLFQIFGRSIAASVWVGACDKSLNFIQQIQHRRCRQTIGQPEGD